MAATERQEIAAKVRALLAKTVDQGCTEQEAIAAAAKAKELMDRYQVDLSEIELEEEGFVQDYAEGPEQRKLNVQDLIGWDIARYCEVESWKSNIPRWLASSYRKRKRLSSLAFAPMSSSPIGS
jgi:hypothetical protein